MGDQMTAIMAYVIKFVADMPATVKFYQEVLGLPLKFQSPQWSEFATGETTLALHQASAQNPAGTVQLGFHGPDHRSLQERLRLSGAVLTRPAEKEGGEIISEYRDPDGSRFSLGQG